MAGGMLPTFFALGILATYVIKLLHEPNSLSNTNAAHFSKPLASLSQNGQANDED